MMEHVNMPPAGDSWRDVRYAVPQNVNGGTGEEASMYFCNNAASIISQLLWSVKLFGWAGYDASISLLILKALSNVTSSYLSSTASIKFVEI